MTTHVKVVGVLYIALSTIGILSALFLALVFTFTIRRQVTQNGLAVGRPPLAKLTAIVSLALWSGVAWGGRWIGFS